MKYFILFGFACGVSGLTMAIQHVQCGETNYWVLVAVNALSVPMNAYWLIRNIK